MTTDTSTRLTEAQNKLAISDAKVRKLEEKLNRLKVMVKLYSAIDTEASKLLIEHIDEEVK